MNPSTIKELQAEILPAINAILAKHNMEAKFGGGTYDPMSYTGKLVVARRNEAGQAETPEFRALKANYPSVAGNTYYHPQHGYFTMIGYVPSRPKFPFLAVIKGKTLKVTRNFIDYCTESRKSS